MALDDLFTALKMFQSNVKEYQTGRSIQSANEMVNQIKASDAKETEKYNQLQQVSQALVTDLASRGTPDTTIESVRSAFMGPQAKSAEDLMMQGLKEGSAEKIDMANKAQKFELTKQTHALESAEKMKTLQYGAMLAKNQQAQDMQVTKEFSKFGKFIEPSAEVRTAYGQNARGMLQAGRLKALIGIDPKEWDKAAPQIVTEAATSLASMVKSGVVTKDEIERFMPHTMAMDASKIESWLRSAPASAKAGDFIALYNKAANREYAEMHAQNDAATLSRASKNFRLYEKDPAQFTAAVATTMGLKPEDIVIDEAKHLVTTVQQQRLDEKNDEWQSHLRNAMGNIRSNDPDKKRAAMAFFNYTNIDPKTNAAQAAQELKYGIMRGLIK